jgi:hypothetical protein
MREWVVIIFIFLIGLWISNVHHCFRLMIALHMRTKVIMYALVKIEESNDYAYTSCNLCKLHGCFFKTIL